MSFQSAFGNNQVNQEFLARTTAGTAGGLLTFGTSGIVEDYISTPIDSNVYIKGGHMQFDNYNDILNIPDAQRIPGMEAYLNTSIGTFESLTTNNIPSAITSVNKKVFAFDNQFVYIVDTQTNNGTSFIILDGSTAGLGTFAGRYILGTTSDHVYFADIDNNAVAKINTSTYFIEKVVLPHSPTSFFYGIIVNNTLYLGNNQTNTYINYVTLNDFTAHTVKDLSGGTDFQVHNIGQMAYSSDNNKLYVFGFGNIAGTNDHIYVVDIITNKIITTINPVGLTSPYYTGVVSGANLYFPSTKKIYAIARFSNKVFSIDTTTDTIVDTISLPGGSSPVTMYIVENFAYTANISAGTVSVIDLSTNTLVTTITAGDGAGGGIGQVAYYQNRLFVPNLNDSTVSVINTKNNTNIGNFTIDGQPRGLTYVVGTNLIYVSNQGVQSIGILNYQPSEKFILQGDSITWENMTSVSKTGDFITGIIGYSDDYSEFFSDRSIPDIAYVKTIITADGISNKKLIDSNTITSIDWANRQLEGTDGIVKMTWDSNVVVNANEFVIPIGNTASRPSPASAGSLRFNNQTVKFEGYDGTAWVNLN